MIDSPLDRNKMEFALDLAEMASEKEDGFRNCLRAALTVMTYGGITAQDMLRYIEEQARAEGSTKKKETDK